MVTIVSFGNGKCIWCCETGEGAQASFKDGLNGFFCKKDFWAAMKARAQPQDATSRKDPNEKE